MTLGSLKGLVLAKWDQVNFFRYWGFLGDLLFGCLFFFFWCNPLCVRWRRKWQPTPVFSPEKSHGHRSLVGYGLWGCGGSDAAEQLSMYPVRAILVYVWLLSCSSSETLNKLLNLPYLSCFFLGAKLKITILTLPHCSED